MPIDAHDQDPRGVGLGDPLQPWVVHKEPGHVDADDVPISTKHELHVDPMQEVTCAYVFVSQPQRV